MKFIKSPIIAAAIAAAIAGTTGTCVLTRGDPAEPPPGQSEGAPVRLLPEAVLPYPLDDLE